MNLLKKPSFYFKYRKTWDLGTKIIIIKSNNILLRVITKRGRVEQSDIIKMLRAISNVMKKRITILIGDIHVALFVTDEKKKIKKEKMRFSEVLLLYIPSTLH